MRQLFAALLLAGLAIAVQAQETKKDTEKKAIEPAPKKKAPEITLKAGDVPPPLVATTWLQGTEVTKFEADKVYVVEFWATWCGPCIVMMPHLSDLQRELREKGVTIIGYTAKDPNNSAEKVASFVEKRGPKLGYTFAYAEERDTYSAWMQAAGRNGIPCTFVIGKDGKIAYIGHPMYLDVVLPKVVAGTWKVEEDNEKLKEVEADVNAVFKATGGKDPEAGLKALTDLDAKYPGMSKIPYFISPKLRFLLAQDKIDEATKFAGSVIASALKQDDTSMLSQMASTLVGPDAKKNKDLAALALDTAEKLVKLVGEKDLGGQMTLARVQFATGDKVKAKASAARVLELAPENNKAAYKRMLKEILGEEGSEKDSVKPEKIVPAKEVEKKP